MVSIYFRCLSSAGMVVANKKKYKAIFCVFFSIRFTLLNRMLWNWIFFGLAMLNSAENLPLSHINTWTNEMRKFFFLFFLVFHCQVGERKRERDRLGCYSILLSVVAHYTVVIGNRSIEHLYVFKNLSKIIFRMKNIRTHCITVNALFHLITFSTKKKKDSFNCLIVLKWSLAISLLDDFQICGISQNFFFY